MIEFKLPSLGADMDQGKLVEWRVKPGDSVKRGDVVAVVDTSKAAVDVEIWHEGTIYELVAEPGMTMEVGTVIATLLAPGETPEAAEAAKRARPALTKVSLREEALAVATGTTQAAAGERRRVSPVARRRAAELGVDVDTIPGTGPHGAITLDDVERAAAEKKAMPTVSGDRGDKQAEMRRAIAAAMSRSKREIPHYYLSDRVPLWNATLWLQGENAQRSLTERVLMAALFLKAVSLACEKYRDMNGFYRNGQFEPGESVHVGVAISLRQGGLIAPAIHDVQKKSITQLMLDLGDLVKRARAGSLRSSEMSDPTITVTNLGDQGVESVFGVIYPPQVALVGFGRVAEQPCIVDAGLRIIPAVTASLAADHRVSDGHRGALFLAEIHRLLQQPGTL
ncbi:MAG: branched-chain alpha-keto acid dehydrogenase subunit E2 [Betaproteobacteria bacterium RIFCSPLOWO2_12_FULL_63_13]|nr:MAG: branched-chain alpha-keto acid dehydrogenase subunit E2 [Betaproteobacteria bacterium RIFCSPLOWO2_12_FULL_63_13]